MSRKLLVNDGSGERELLLIGTMAVGRDPRCDISDANPLLSRRHAEFQTTSAGVRVRDLESRNGMLVNGARATDAVLHPDDVVTVGNLAIKYVDDGSLAVLAPSEPAEDDATALVGLSVTGALELAPTALPQPDREEDDQGTRMIALPGAPDVPRPAEATPSEVDLPNATMAIARPPPTAVSPRPTAAAPAAEPAAFPPVRTAVARRQQKGRTANTSWATRMLIAVMSLAAAVFVVTAIPLQLFQARVVDSMASARATALVNWLAADAAVHLGANESLVTAADAVGQEPGVLTAVILSPDGRVLSPASRATERFDMLPGIAEPPANIFRLRSASAEGVIEIARPFGTTQRPRAGVAWVTFRSSVPAEAGSVLVMLGPALLLTLAGGLTVAHLINRMTTRALVAFNEDIDLAVTGQLADVRDTLGAKPLGDVAATVNYLIARLKGPAGARAAGPRETRAGGAAVLDDYADGPFPSMPLAPQPTARIEANAQFRVTSASPECADLLGVRPDALVGLHLMDAIPQKEIVDAVFKCVGSLGASRQETVVLSPEGRPYQLELTVSQQDKDQPIGIGLRVLEGVRA